MNTLYHILRHQDFEFALSKGEINTSVLKEILSNSNINFKNIICFYSLKDIEIFSFFEKEKKTFLVDIDNLGGNESRKKKMDIFKFTIFNFIKDSIPQNIVFIPVVNDITKESPEFSNLIQKSKENDIYIVHGSIEDDFKNLKPKKINNQNVYYIINSNNNSIETGKIANNIFGEYNKDYVIELKNDQLKLEYEPEQFSMIKTFDASMIEQKHKAKYYSQLDENILILGETGTGKELFAQSIHESSLRKDKKIVSVNCAAIPDKLFESEMFGHTKGGFTDANDHDGFFIQANNSTLFLDEIGEISLQNQKKILRAIQEKEVRKLGKKGPIKIDVRLICATNQHIDDESIFRSDLYYRINQLELYLPPLRERDSKDIKILIDHFLKIEKDKKVEKDMDADFSYIEYSPEALLEIYNYVWPGNVRELENFVRKTFNDAVNWYRSIIDVDDISILLKLNNHKESVDKVASNIETPSVQLNLKEKGDQLKKIELDKLLEDGLTQKEIADKIGLSQSTVSRMVKKLKLKKGDS